MSRAFLCLWIAASLCAVLGPARPADADEPAAEAAGADAAENEAAAATEAQAPPGEPQTVTVVEVSGRARKLAAGKDGDKPTWQPLRVGDELGENAVVCTGFGGRAVLRFAYRGEVVVEPVSEFGIAEFRKSGNAVRARLGLKFGSISASVDSSAGPNDWKVTTAQATAAVTGTSGGVAYNGDVGLGLRGTTGRWDVASGPSRCSVLPTEVTRQATAGQMAQPAGRLARPIEVAKVGREMQLGDAFGGLTGREKQTARNLGNNTRSPVGGLVGSEKSGEPEKKDRIVRISPRLPKRPTTSCDGGHKIICPE